LEIRNDIAPNIAPGRFDLLIAGQVKAVGQGDNGTTGEVALSPAIYSFGEQAVPGTTLSNYTTTVVCKDVNGTGATLSTSEAGIASWTVELGAGADVVCVITNTVEVPAACAGMLFDAIILGTEGADSINGSGLRELIKGNLGNDVLNGGAGNDCIVGEDGNDTISGGSGNDRLSGDEGNDKLDGGSGTDQAIGGAASDTCIAKSRDPSCER
jgi:Ca2+-binding RTX toxin-like protein